MKGSYKTSKQSSINVASMVEEEEVPEFVVNEIERLQECGINMADINKLKNAGFSSVKSVLMATKKDLTAIKGITDQRAEKLQEAALKVENAGFITGYDQLLKRYRQRGGRKGHWHGPELIRGLQRKRQKHLYKGAGELGVFIPEFTCASKQNRC